MEIALHIGANCTDDDQLLKSVMKNPEVLADHGVSAPGPGKYRRLIRETIQNLDGAPPAPGLRHDLLAEIQETDQTRRLLLSNSNFICVPNRIFEDGHLYALAESKVKGFLDLFPDDEVDLYLALRDPATFLPAAYRKSKADSFGEFMQGRDPHALVWSDLVRRIRAVAPQASLTVWCNEDTPLIWAELIRDFAGLPPDVPISGGFDLLAAIMSAEGMQRCLAYLHAHPPKTDAQARGIIAAFMDKYAIGDAVEETVDLPGLTAVDIADLSEAYDEDVAQIVQMADVTFIMP